MEDFFRTILVIIVSIFNGFLNLLPFLLFVLYMLFMFVLISLVSFLLIVFIAFAIANIIAKSSYLKLRQKCLYGDYDFVISKGPKLVTWYSFVSKMLPLSNARKIIDALNIFLAISFLSKDNSEKFLYYINRVNKNVDHKEFWISIYYLLQKNVKLAEDHYKNLCESKTPQEDMICFLDAMFLYETGNPEQAREKMNMVHSKLNYKFTQEIAHKII